MTDTALLEKLDVERLYLGLAVQAQQQITFNIHHKKRVIVIAGPTGCGKSAFALTLANKIGGEIISADSMQVYRGMDIGTAKPTKEEQLQLPHHLIDVRDVTDNFNVVDFYYEARQACQAVLNRDNIPIIVGGSGFYLHSLIYGPPAGPPSVREVREKLEKELELKGPEILYERLRQLDPEYASTVTNSDRQKIIRGLEIITLTGKKVSKLAWRGKVRPITFDYHCWFLHRPREHLYRRIDKRCEHMLADGLLEEVIHMEKQGLRENSSAAQAIGYRQALDYLSSPRTEADFNRFIESFRRASRNYAKRQLTWFRKEPLFRWLDLDTHDDEVAMDIIYQDYQAKLF